jgi:hypothetical protein
VYVSVVLTVTLLNSATALRLMGSFLASEPLPVLWGVTGGIDVAVVVLSLGCSAKKDGVVENAQLVLFDI